jgi:hypothetical protein
VSDFSWTVLKCDTSRWGVDGLRDAIQNADPFGALHIVISDLNTDDENIWCCARRPDATDDEKQICCALLEMSEDEREPFLISCGC